LGGGGGDDEQYSGGASFRDDASRSAFDEYDAGEYENRASQSAGSSSRATHKAPTPGVISEAPAAKETDLLGGFGADGAAASAPSLSKPLPTPLVSLDDDFDDFQSAPPAPVIGTTSLTAVPTHSRPSANVVGSTSSTPINTSPKSTNVGWSNPLHAVSCRPALVPSHNSKTPTQTTSSSFMNPDTISFSSKPASPGEFDDLWSLGLGGGTISSMPSTAVPANGKTIKDLERERMEAGMWGKVGDSTIPTPAGVQGKLTETKDDDLLL